MRSLLVQCTTSLAAALTLASFGIHFLYADNAREIPQQAMKLNQRGLSHLHKEEYDQAIVSFREALQIQPEYPDALDNLGKALDATGKDAEAMADFDKAIKIAPNNAAAYADRGMALFHEGKYEAAAASYRQAIDHHSKHPDQPGPWASLGHLYYKSKRYHQSASAFQKSLAHKHDQLEVLLALGQTQTDQGKLSDAIQSYEHCLALKPDEFLCDIQFG